MPLTMHKVYQLFYWDLILWISFSCLILGDLRILVPLSHKEAIAGDSVTFECRLHTLSDLSQVRIRWKHKNDAIDQSQADKYQVTNEGQTLTIAKVTVEDAGEYTCVAISGSFKDRSSAVLTVKTTPDPPRSMKIVRCAGQLAELSWETPNTGGVEILSYLVQFNTSDNPSHWNNYYEEIPGTDTKAMITLLPYGTYSFRMLTKNTLGYSEPSLPTAESCTTPPDHPDGNPSNVRTLTYKKKKLIIAWMPMPRLYHNGPGFHYKISWRPKKSTFWNVIFQEGANSKQVEIDVDDIYGLYEIKVRAVNNIGESFQPPFIKLGHSGEAEPLESPKDFRLDPLKPVESHTAHFIWESVDTSEEKIRGNFRGYKLRYWKSSEGRHKWKEEDIIVDTGDALPLPDVRATIGGLPAYTALRAQVSVMNGHYTGPPSHTIDFFTPEGVPGPVRDLYVDEKSKESVVLRWLPPDEPNGILIGYDIGYQQLTDEDQQVGPVKSLVPQITNPSVLGARIRRLAADHKYRFLVWARTKAGRGQAMYIDVRTPDGSEPTPPRSISSKVLTTSANVTWGSLPYNDPDVQYLIEYSQEGDSKWVTTDSVVGKSWKLLKGLRPHTKYNIRVLAMNGLGVTKASKQFSIITEPQKDYSDYHYDASNGHNAGIYHPNSASRTLPLNIAFLLQVTVVILHSWTC